MKQIMMKNKIITIICLALLMLTETIQAQEKNMDTKFKQMFPIGDKLPEQTAQYFIGQAYIATLTNLKELNVPTSNVTFEPGCRNNWHSHTGGQLLIVTTGIGYYQEKGKAAQQLLPGDVVEIAPDVVHWHGASPDSWFAHLAIGCNPKINKTTWDEAVNDVQYLEATTTTK